MSLKDCLLSAVDQGAISREEASFLSDEFDNRFAQSRLSLGDTQAAADARATLEKALRGAAIEKKRRADLTEAARLNVLGRLTGEATRDGRADAFSAAMGLLSHYGFRTGSSVRGRTEAIIAASHTKVADLMFAMRRRGVLGRRPNKALEKHLVREMHGEASGDATAKELARSLSEVFEDLRQRFNAAGGAIGKLDNWGMPHTHDRLKVKAMGRDKWKAEIRPLLDPSRMLDPLTGRPIDPARLEASLDHVFASIVSDNRAHMQPQMIRRGLGAIAGQRQEERFLTFKDAESWLAYHGRFGKGDVTEAIFNHINRMGRDVAAMEELGPNPAAMVEYAKQVVGREIGRLEAGMPSLAREGLFKNSQARLAEYRIDALWQKVRGDPTVVSGWANTTANIKNVMTSALLGSTALLAAATDPFIAGAARRLAGMPVKTTIGDIAKMLKTANREEIIRAGVVWDEYMHVMADELRFAGPAIGSEWSRWVVDRSVTFSGLKPLTTGRKLVEARFWQEHVANLAREGKSFDKLDPRFRRALEGFGVTSEDWAIWTSAIDANGFVTPRQIELNGGQVRYLDAAAMRDPVQATAETKALMHRRAAEKMIETYTSWSERSVPSGTPNARSVITGKAERGTVAGELVDYMLQFKSFGLSFTSLQIEAIGEMALAKGGGKGMRSGLGYFAALAVPLTLGAGAYIQIKSLLDGKDPQDMTTPQFWTSALITGGGFGLFGDFVKASENRFGQSFAGSLPGPGIAFMGDTFGLTIDNVMQAARGEDTKAGREAVKYLGRYTPVLSSHWATRGAYRRLFLDNLQWLADPLADASFKASAQNAKQNGAEFWFPPGAATPSRKAGRVRQPDMGNAIGN
jgi:hypothetical protein